MAAPRDTSPAAFEEQIKRLRQAGPEARVAMAVDMSDAVHDLVIASVRRRNPGADETLLREALSYAHADGAYAIMQALIARLYRERARPKRPVP